MLSIRQASRPIAWVGHLMTYAVYVLHCFGKKTQRTSEQDKRIAKARYQAVQQELRNRK
ncbi:type II toxin-antitoxin system RelE/ParE family toxin [Pseudocitrobacter cyperus]|uniref:type II toxin-antitoxin system RelE/ParE family toxin n=1 Tax=Pseudocitrobacter cyperus TaxID=3112843 RepID=UPI00398C65A6